MAKSKAAKKASRRMKPKANYHRHITEPATASAIRRSLAIRQSDVEAAHRLLSALSLND